MTRLKKIYYLFGFILASAFMAGMLLGCGNNWQLVDGGTLEIDPDGYAFTTAVSCGDESDYSNCAAVLGETDIFTVVARDKEGKPRNEWAVRLEMDEAVAIVSPDGNTIYDNPVWLKSDAWGKVEFRIWALVGATAPGTTLKYDIDLTAKSGTASDHVVIEVTFQE